MHKNFNLVQIDFSSKCLAVLFIILTVSELLVAQVNGGFVHGGIQRNYILYRPQNQLPDEKLPLMIVLHGYTQSANSVMLYTGFNQVAEENRFVVAYPEGINASWNAGIMGGSTADDTGFLTTLIDTLIKKAWIDPSRVYACGMSNGGFMSYRLACEAGERFAAIGSVAGTMTFLSAQSCMPAVSMPVVHIHGTADVIVPYDGNNAMHSVSAVLNLWKGFDSCQKGTPSFVLHDDHPDNSWVEQYDWTDCAGNSEVRLYKVVNGGHTWPGAVDVSGLGATNRDISASEVIWEFVGRFSRAVPHGMVEKPLNPVRIIENPVANGILRLSAGKSGTVRKADIIGLNGTIIGEFFLEPGTGEYSLETGNLAPGFYLFRISGAEGVQTGRFIVL